MKLPLEMTENKGTSPIFGTGLSGLQNPNTRNYLSNFQLTICVCDSTK